MRKKPEGLCCWHKPTEIGGLKFTLYDSGHIPGSKQILIENGSKILYTGDLNYAGGAITPKAETPNCDILILEATFGKPRFTFPDKKQVAKEMLEWCREQHAKKKTPVFLGYAIGKAQELTKIFSGEFNTFVDDSIYDFNIQTERSGPKLGSYRRLKEFSNSSDSVIIVPPSHRKRFETERYSIAYASGWASENWWKGRYKGFIFSDHSDFNGLLDFVEKVSPQAVYTTHGFAREFSRSLREKGFYSEPLSEVQKKLDGYVS